MIGLQLGTRITGFGYDFMENYTIVARSSYCAVMRGDGGGIEYLFPDDIFIVGETLCNEDVPEVDFE